MKIAVNTRLLLRDRFDGISVFTAECLRRICQAHPEHQFFFLFDRPFEQDFIYSSNISARVVPPPTRHPLLWYTWLRYSLPQTLRMLRPDLFLSTDGFLPFRCPAPMVNVIHDLNFEHYPYDLPFSSRFFYRHYFPVFAQSACRIATVSEYSRRDIAEQYRLDEGRIDVVYNGANPCYQPLGGPEKEKIRMQWTTGAEFFLFVGNLHPRKNVVRLLLAFDQFRKRSGLPVKLVIVGDYYFRNRELKRTFSELENRGDVIFTGPLDPGSLSRLMASALALVYAPYFEGFGIPILEAMCCDVPVICSRVTSMPEVAGGAALLVDPFSVTEIADAMHRMANRPDLRKELIEKGRLARTRFSWDLTAEKLWNTMQKCLAL